MVILYKDPRGETVLENLFSYGKESKPAINCTVGDLSELTDADKIHLLQNKMNTLESMIKEKEIKILELKNILNS